VFFRKIALLQKLYLEITTLLGFCAVWKYYFVKQIN